MSSRHPEWLVDKVAQAIHDVDGPWSDPVDNFQRYQARAVLDALIDIGGFGWLSNSGPPRAIYGLDDFTEAHASTRCLVIPFGDASS